MTIDTSKFFRMLFDRTRSAAMLILNEDGIILKINSAFTYTLGYHDSDLINRNFKMLFTAADRVLQLPEKELERVKAQGFSHDNNFLLHKNGMPIWVTGESICIQEEGSSYYIKLVQEIHQQKLLEKFLQESNAMVNTIFESITCKALVVVDQQLKVRRVNPAFFQIFELPELELEGTGIGHIRHPFWQNEGLQTQVKAAFSSDEPLTHEDGQLVIGASRYTMHIRCIDSFSLEKRILMVIDRTSRPDHG
ncbi:MAG: PAS domain S-box protein [Sphingobacteriales bacterium]|nr:MAG: PAS domain S-box protein [Sphingobacteriales bacterium]